ncbi:ABC transporter permease subunit [Bacillus sp. CRN 9]|nr:ABC transporter permease subunit [Bacillus sp. CRN 9]
MISIKALLKQVILYIVIICALILIVLIPRDFTVAPLETKGLEIHYQFSWTAYGENITRFISGIWNHHSLGATQYERVTVEDELVRYVPRSLQIIIPAFLLSMILGILKGVYDYVHRYNKRSILGNGLTWLFQSIPDFFIVVCIQWGVTLLFPSLKLLSQNTSYSFLLPAILVSIYPMMYTARITSNALSNEDGQYYIKVAQSKGFSQKRVIYKHIFANALKSILSHTTSIMVHLMTSLLIVEYLLGYQGLSYRLFTAFGYKYSAEAVSFSLFESGVIIGIGLVFMSLVILAQLTGYLLKRGLRIL